MQANSVFTGLPAWFCSAFLFFFLSYLCASCLIFLIHVPLRWNVRTPLKLDPDTINGRNMWIAELQFFTVYLFLTFSFTKGLEKIRYDTWSEGGFALWVLDSHYSPVIFHLPGVHSSSGYHFVNFYQAWSWERLPPKPYPYTCSIQKRCLCKIT